MSKRERDPPSVKMHMTLIKAGRGEKSKSVARKKVLDVTGILENYVNYDFGSQEVNEIKLSSMLEKNDDVYYETISSVTF